jgi:hypothetical protein
VTDIRNIVNSHGLTATQAISVLTGISAWGDAAAKSAVGSAIANMINSNQITGANAIATICAAGNVNAFNEGSLITPAVVGSEIAALVASHLITADQLASYINTAVSEISASDVLVGALAYASANTADSMLSSSFIHDIATVLASRPRDIFGISDAVNESALPASQAVSILMAVAKQGSATVQYAVGGEMTALVSDERGLAWVTCSVPALMIVPGPATTLQISCCSGTLPDRASAALVAATLL